MRYLSFLAFVFLVLSAPAHAQTLEGWNQVSAEIDRTAPANIASLNGRRFQVRLGNTSANSLVLTPREAFSVTPAGSGLFTVEIVNADALVRRVGTVVQKLPVGWTATYVRTGTDEFPISIEGVDQCVFSLTFRQRGGDILDLTETARDFNVSWRFSNPSAIATNEISGRSLVLTRSEGNNSDVSVVLRLRSNDGTIDVSSQPIPVPKCGRFVSNTPDNTAIVQLRTPGQCVVPTSNQSDQETLSGRMVHRFKETFANSCDRPVRCNFRWHYARYRTVQDGIARQNGILLDEAFAPGIVIGANMYVNLNEEVETNFMDAPYYSWGHHQTPDGAVTGFSNPDVVCRWADEG